MIKAAGGIGLNLPEQEVQEASVFSSVAEAAELLDKIEQLYAPKGSRWIRSKGNHLYTAFAEDPYMQQAYGQWRF